jgi:hypothetical protein
MGRGSEDKVNLNPRIACGVFVLAPDNTVPAETDEIRKAETANTTDKDLDAIERRKRRRRINAGVVRQGSTSGLNCRA